MPFLRPSLSDLISRMRDDFDTRMAGAVSRLRHSVLDVFARSFGGALSGLYGFLVWQAEQLMFDTSDGEWLNRHGGIWGVPRKAATAARATISVTGGDGAVIPAGAELHRADGARYAVEAAATVAAGSATVAVAALVPGIAGSLDAGAVLTFASPVAGVLAEGTVAAVLTAGADEEGDEALRARLLSRVRQTPQGGTLNDYVQWALAQPGVTRAWAYGEWLGAGTVGLAFVLDGRPDPLPLPADVLAVQAALDVLRPVTARLTVFAPTARAVDVQLRIMPDSPQVRAAITAELADLFTREAAPGQTLYHSRLSEAASLAEGEFHHTLVSPAQDVPGEPGMLPRLGTVSFV